MEVKEQVQFHKLTTLKQLKRHFLNPRLIGNYLISFSNMSYKLPNISCFHENALLSFAEHYIYNREDHVYFTVSVVFC